MRKQTRENVLRRVFGVVFVFEYRKGFLKHGIDIHIEKRSAFFRFFRIGGK